MEIKEYHIGIAVFEKPEDFDPRTDSIVRVEARRLRSKLHEYYDTEGRLDDVEIALPQRGYAAVIRQRSSASPAVSVPSDGDEKTLAIQAFVALTSSKRAARFSQGLTDELAHAITKLKHLRVLSGFRFRGSPTARPMVDVVLQGSVRAFGDTTRVCVQLINAADGALLWTRIYEHKIKDVFAYQDEICGSIVESVELRLALPKYPPVQAPIQPADQPKRLAVVGSKEL